MTDGTGLGASIGEGVCTHDLTIWTDKRFVERTTASQNPPKYVALGGFKHPVHDNVGLRRGAIHQLTEPSVGVDEVGAAVQVAVNNFKCLTVLTLSHTNTVTVTYIRAFRDRCSHIKIDPA
ncbi:Hypothetical protein CINCED_3A001551 [Cinara cedri]|uniref:Uncharacterized protein n=1 Tax=Cinara cedri TaxID=506608 RepID=A0A5E4MUQ4_9HEMI|nr:Hypothetical protein CINCED_3A001551 [Cinara cedri]